MVISTEDLVLDTNPKGSGNFSELTHRKIQKACKKRNVAAQGSTEELDQRLKEAVDLAKTLKDQNIATTPEEGF